MEGNVSDANTTVSEHLPLVFASLPQKGDDVAQDSVDSPVEDGASQHVEAHEYVDPTPGNLTPSNNATTQPTPDGQSVEFSSAIPRSE